MTEVFGEDDAKHRELVARRDLHPLDQRAPHFAELMLTKHPLHFPVERFDRGVQDAVEERSRTAGPPTVSMKRSTFAPYSWRVGEAFAASKVHVAMREAEPYQGL